MMKIISIVAAQLLMMASVQAVWAQEQGSTNDRKSKLLIYKVDKSRIELNTSEVDSMVFVSGENDYEKPFNLEGHWYLSGRSGAGESFYGKDSITYSYDEKVLGYQEFSFRLNHGEGNYYSVSYRIRWVAKKEDESLEDYSERLQNGQYSSDELVMSDWIRYDKNKWIVIDSNLYTYTDLDIGCLPQIAKFVKKSYNQFTLATVSYDLIDFAFNLGEPFTYNCYLTFTRIE